MAKLRPPSAGPAKKFGYAQMLRDVLVASINKGQFPLALIGLVVIVMLLKMPGNDVSKLVFHIVDKLEQGSILGWILFGLVAFGWYLHAKRLRRIFSDEMNRITGERTQLQSDALGHRVKSSEGAK